VISYLWVYKTAILIADQQEYRIKKISIAVNFTITIVQILVMCSLKNYIVYLLVNAIGSLINNIIASHVAESLYPYIKEKVEITHKEKIDIFKNLGSVFVYKISNALMNATDNVLISMLVGTVVVGYYSNYTMIQNQIMTFYRLLFTSMTASIGNLIVTELPERRYKVFKCQQSISFVICLIIVPCFALLANDFIAIWLGERYILDKTTLNIICLNMYLACVLQPLWTYREAAGLYRKTKWIMLICSFENIILSIVLGKIIGLKGILLASALSRLSTYIWYEPKILFRDFFCTNPKGYYVSMLKNLVIIIGILFVGEMLSDLIIIDGILKWIIKAFAIGIICSIVALFNYWNSDGIMYIRSKVRYRQKL
jgi:O-antigen/teichoic acid export membrane protein